MRIEKLARVGWKYLTSADYRFLINANMGLHNTMRDDLFIRRKFKATMGYDLNLDYPKTYNEKLQWLKLYDRKPEYTMMVDKYRVREYIAKTIGEEYLIPLLGVWEDPENIDFDALPDQFVLKCNHNSGLGMCICKDKSKLDIKKVKQDLRRGLRQDYYLTGREWPYRDVPRRIIAEKYMVDESGSELKDYKVVCFDGESKMIQLHQGRFENHTQDFYDTNWKRFDIEQGYPYSKAPMERPGFLNQMLALSEQLSNGIPQLRVDWYYTGEQLYFGELTFFDGSGFEMFNPKEWDYIFGEWISLPKAGEENI